MAAAGETALGVRAAIPAREETFEPLRSRHHTCRPLAGRVVPVAMWMCLVESGNVLSRTDDLIVVATTTDARDWQVDVEDCLSAFARRDGIAEPVRSGPVRLVVNGRTGYRRFVLQERLSPQERAAWRTASVNSCAWTAVEARPPRSVLLPRAAP